jgi:hypothetical protein
MYTMQWPGEFGDNWVLCQQCSAKIVVNSSAEFGERNAEFGDSSAEFGENSAEFDARLCWNIAVNNSVDSSVISSVNS